MFMIRQTWLVVVTNCTLAPISAGHSKLETLAVTLAASRPLAGASLAML